MDEKKLEILERASGVYMRLGIKSVTMDDLARELGISKKTIYKYFDDKDDLVRSIIELKVGMDSAICQNCQITSENAIDDLLNVSQLVVEHFSNINPTVFFDLRKYHPDAWQIMEKHKWGFVKEMIRKNIDRGIEDQLYRRSLNPDIIANLYVASTDALMDSRIFPWPQFKFQEVYSQMIKLHLHGMANEEGKKYLKQRLKSDDNE